MATPKEKAVPAWLMTEGNEVQAEDLELPATAARPSAPPSNPKMRPSVPRSWGPAARGAGSRAEYKDAERERILSALTASNWNRVQAAKLIGIPRRTFYRRLKEFGIL